VHAVIIGPFSSGMLYFAAAKKMGMTTSAITVENENYAIPDHVRADIDNLIIINHLDIDTIVGAVSRLNKDHPIDCLLAGDEFLVEHTAHASYVIGLAGMNPRDASVVRNKSLMRKRLHEAHIRIPRFEKATTALDLEHISKNVGFPAVIKPLQMAGSIGVARVDNPVELLAAYEDIINDTEGGWGVELGTEALVEELLVGTEYCVDGYVTKDGAITVFEFVKIELGAQPHFQEIGYTAYNPEDLPESEVMTTYIKEVVTACGIIAGPFHSEVMLTKDGPVLIEIANRLPGDYVPQLVERATGISFAACALAAAAGIKVPEPETRVAKVTASQYIIAPTLIGETYQKLTGWEEILQHPLVDNAVLEIKPGEMIPGHVDARSRVAEIEFHADTSDGIEKMRRYIIETVHAIN